MSAKTSKIVLFRIKLERLLCFIDSNGFYSYRQLNPQKFRGSPLIVILNFTLYSSTILPQNEHGILIS